MFRKIIVAAVVAGAGLSLAAAAEASRVKYELRRIPMGPRPDHYVLVRADRQEPAGARHAVTRPQRHKIWKLRVVQRWAGPHYIGPVWVRDEGQDD